MGLPGPLAFTASELLGAGPWNPARTSLQTIGLERQQHLHVNPECLKENESRGPTPLMLQLLPVGWLLGSM